MHTLFKAFLLFILFGIDLTQATEFFGDNETILTLEANVARSPHLKPTPVAKLPLSAWTTLRPADEIKAAIATLPLPVQQELFKSRFGLTNALSEGEEETNRLCFTIDASGNTFDKIPYDGKTFVFTISGQELTKDVVVSPGSKPIRTIRYMGPPFVDEPIATIEVPSASFGGFEPTLQAVLVSDCFQKGGTEDRYGYYLGILNLTTKSLHPIVVSKEPRLLSAKLINGKVYYIFEKNTVGGLYIYDPATKASAPVIEDPSREIIGFGANASGTQSFIEYRRFGSTYMQSFSGLFAGTGREEMNVTKIIYFPHSNESVVIKASDRGLPTVHLRSTEDEEKLILDRLLAVPSEIPVPVFPLITPSSMGDYHIPVNVWLPHGTSAKNRAPLVVYAHGGPHNFVKTMFNPLFQCFVNQGWAIAAADYSGSSGHGHKHRTSINGDLWKGAHEVAYVTDILKQSALIDAGRVTFVGISHGGFFGFVSMVTPAIAPTYTGGIVSLAGISDWATRHPAVEIKGTTVDSKAIDINSWASTWLHRYEFSGHNPGSDAKFNASVSPLSHVDKMKDINVPCLVIHGKDDKNVPVAQSDRFVAGAIQHKPKAPLHYVTIPGAGHSFSGGTALPSTMSAVLSFLQSGGKSVNSPHLVDPKTLLVQ